MTQLVAIINLTPDSFSDGRQNATTEDYLRLIQQAIHDGASVIDIGAESTRPGARLLTQEEEWSRLKPMLQTLNLKPQTSLSIDTRHAETFRRAIEYGAKWFNDVSGFHHSESVQLAKDSSCDVVLMHSLTVPADPKVTLPEDLDVISTILEWAEKRITQLGIAKEKIIFDPGIGFGKTPEQSWEIIRNIAAFKALGTRIMVGHSRKSFLQVPMEERDTATAQITRDLAKAGVDYVRVHNIPANKQALEI